MPPARHSFLPPPRERAPEPSGFIYPGPSDRLTINGMTGSGKTTFAAWLFAESADFDKKPWIFLDYKREALVQTILGEGMAEEVKISGRIPEKPGVYVAMPDPREPGSVTDFLWKIYEKGHCGLFLDEATMVPELRGEANTGGPFQSILSQGRSKTIPCWVLAQRPVHVNKMVYTESNYYAAFRLRSKDDLKRVVDAIPEDSANFDRVWSSELKLRRYQCRWYDAEQDRSFILKPVPSPDRILDILAARIDKSKKREAI